jgi:hypothetical protein
MGGVPVVAEPEERVGETQHYYAIAEPDDAGGFWISFPDGPGIFSAANSAGGMMPMRRPRSPQPQKESADRALDWAAAATEARRERDAKVKAALTERGRLGRQANAWSPQIEIFRTGKV